MTETLPAVRNVPGVTIRPYRPLDHNPCRRLWGELSRHRNELYRGSAEPDSGAGFEEYLTQLNLSGMWVAESGREVCGFLGLKLEGRAGEVDPVIVAEPMRGRGIGRALLATVVEEARRRGLARLTVSPPLRDVSALRTLHAAGFVTAATVTLAVDLGGRAATTSAPSTIDLHGLRFTA